MTAKTCITALAVVATLAATTGAAPTVASAATVNGSLPVSATVTANCTISTSALAFGNVNTFSGSNVDGTGGLSISCTNGTDWSASAGSGGGSGANFAHRRMTGGANLLDYNIYTSVARTTVWGDGTAGSGLIAGTGSGAAQSVTVYGRIPSGQTSVLAGSYADMVTVTVTY